MATAESAAKICVVCGQNVAGKPRVKDAAGHYMCAGACQEKAAVAAKAKAAPPPPPVATPARSASPAKPPVGKAGEGNLLGDLISSSPMLNSAMCPECSTPMPGGAVLCTRCGFNTQTGKALRTAVVRDKETKEPKVKAAKYQNKYAQAEAGPSFWKMLIFETIFLIVLGLMPLAGPEAGLAGIVIYLVTFLVAWVGGTIAAFKNDQMLWGICGILIIVPGVNVLAFIAFVIYNLLFNEDKYSRALFLAFVMAFVINIIVIVVAVFAFAIAFSVGGQSFGS